MIKLIKRIFGFSIRLIVTMIGMIVLVVILENMGIYIIDTDNEESIFVGLIFFIAAFWCVHKWNNEGKVSNDSQLSEKQTKRKKRENESAESVEQEIIEKEKEIIEVVKSEKEKEESNKKPLEWEKEIYYKMKKLSVKEAINFKNNQLAEGNPTDEQRNYMNNIVSEKRREEKVKKGENATKQKKDFFNENNLTILPNGNIRDENFEEYELEEERGDFIVYKPEGMRGKRAYIKTDAENYLAWSGPIKIADKSKFLRGDLEKAKEEVKSSQETAVNEKEDENIEPPQEETEINDATEDIGAKLEKLTKLYEEGILTKEEFQKKSDALISQI